jgi:hypothetical protein
MANPNILESSTVQGNNSLVAATTNAQAVVNNAASSGKVFKINSIVASNVDGSAAQDVTLNVYSEDDLGGTAYAIAYTISVPADASLILVDKTTSLYLKEDQSIGVIAGGNSDIVVTASWEEIS